MTVSCIIIGYQLDPSNKGVNGLIWLDFCIFFGNQIGLFRPVGSQIVAHTQMETGDGPNKPNTINL